jgi:hypothetical protein
MNYSGKNIRISNDVHQQIVDHLSEAVKIGKWVETAIKEKIERENNSKYTIFNPDQNYVAGIVRIPREYDNLETK